MWPQGAIKNFIETLAAITASVASRYASCLIGLVLGWKQNLGGKLQWGQGRTQISTSLAVYVAVRLALAFK